MERVVGWFVILAMLLLGFGFAYYVYTTAERKGWFKTKAPFFTFTERATGLKVGDPVQLMGFDVGQITVIDAQPPRTPYNVYVEFEIKAPYYGYLWTEGSRAKINAADFLGKRVLEVTKGTSGHAAYLFRPVREVGVDDLQGWPDLTNWRSAQMVFEMGGTNIVTHPWAPLTNLPAIAAAGCTNIIVLDRSQERQSITAIWNRKTARYERYGKTTKPFWLESDESPALTERLDQVVGQIEAAVPNILNLTNQLTQVLSNSAKLTSNLNLVVQEARPAVSNLTAVTSQLDRPGALGEWLLPTNINQRLDATLGQADATLASADTNLTALVENLNRSLDNLAGITSNLNTQVQANTNLLEAISQTIVHADQFVQGLKRHWLLRSAFKPSKTNAPPPLVSPKANGD